jgi:fumarate reductase subunit D
MLNIVLQLVLIVHRIFLPMIVPIGVQDAATSRSNSLTGSGINAISRRVVLVLVVVVLFLYLVVTLCHDDIGSTTRRRRRRRRHGNKNGV